MNLKKIKDSINAIKTRSWNVDYGDEAVYEVDGVPFGKSKIITTATDDSVLYVMIGEDDPNELAALWKVPNRRKVAYTAHRDRLANYLNNQEDLERLAEWYDISVEEVKADLQDCYANFDAYMNKLVDEIKDYMGNRSV